MTIGLLLGAVSAALIFVLLTGLSQKTSILVAKQDIPPYSTVSQAMLQTETVAKSSVTQYDLTPSQFSSNKTFVNRVEILPGQRVDSRALSPATDGSLQAVKPGEVAVAVTTTLAAVVGGAVLPGDVVDVYSVNGGQTSSGAASSSSGLLVSDAKVIGVGYGPDATASLLPTGDKPLNGKTSSSASQNVVVILAVPQQVLSTLAGSFANSGDVYLALDPHLSFTATGTLCQVGQCAAQGASVTSGTTGPTGTTGQTGTTTATTSTK